MQIRQETILNSLIQEASESSHEQVSDFVQGTHMVGIKTLSSMGLCSKLPPEDLECSTLEIPQTPAETSLLLPRLKSQHSLDASWALAAINSLLNNTRAQGLNLKAQDLLLRLGREKNVAVIGHFPFVNKMRDAFQEFWVIEKRPKPRDIPDTEMPAFLPRADVIAITATTLLNNTLASVLSLASKNSVKILMGPSTPMASCLFHLGIDYLAGAKVLDPQEVSSGIKNNVCFRNLSGVDYFLLPKDHP